MYISEFNNVSNLVFHGKKKETKYLKIPKNHILNIFSDFKKQNYIEDKQLDLVFPCGKREWPFGYSFHNFVFCEKKTTGRLGTTLKILHLIVNT